MKKLALLISFLLWIYSFYSQQISTSSGSTLQNEFSAEWIIGGSLFDNSLFSLDENVIVQYIDSSNIDFIDVYPTLTMDYLTIVRKNDSGSVVDYTISNYLGINLIKGTIHSGTPYELDVKDLSSGYYFILFSIPDDNKFLVYKKFLKL